MNRRARALLVVALFAAACGDAGPASAPGTVDVALVSPNGDEGAAVITFSGTGIGEISATTGTVYSREDDGRVTVVVVNEPGGELSFRMALADTTDKPVATVEQVAATNDALRTTLAGYTVEFRQ